MRAAAHLRTLTGPEELARWQFPDLSDWFDPFLPHFIREALRCGGEVLLAEEGATVRGLYLHHPAERVDSVFTRDRSLVDGFRTARDPPSLYTPFRIAPDDEVFHILALDTGAWPGVGGFTYAPRFATPEDLPPIRGLLTDVYGGLDERWFATLPSAEERCFLVEVDGTLAGVAWATLAGAHGRLHSLSVRPAYRRLGIGTDLWAARVLWLRAAGARRVISEVGERNLPSQAVAARGGMRRVGRMFRHDRALADPA